MSTQITSPFLAAANGQRAGRTPVWFMRQAGRSLPEYRAVRGEGSILDAIKLWESGMADDCDEVWVVSAGREQQIARIIARNKVDRAEAERRIDAQPPQSEKIAKADVVIDNSGTLEETRTQVEQAWSQLTKHDSSPIGG